MHMTIDETGKDNTLIKIANLDVWVLTLGNLMTRSDYDDFVVSNEHAI